MGGWNAAISGAWPASTDQGSFQISVDGGPWTPINLSQPDLNCRRSGVQAIAAEKDNATFNYIAGIINSALSAGTTVTVGHDRRADHSIGHHFREEKRAGPFRTRQ